jgi:hypothetical protein
MIEAGEEQEPTCYAITQAYRYGQQRCLKPASHRGFHWDNAQRVPEGCECKYFCRCDG